MTTDELRERLRLQNEVCLGNPMDHSDHTDNYPDLCADAITELEARDREIQTWKDTVRDRTYELSQAKREIDELRANLEQAEYENWYKPQEGEE